jgi:anthranilate synthase component 1
MKTRAKGLQVRSYVYSHPRVCEAFDVFKACAETYGPEQVFLLDSVKDPKSRYCSSLIGLFPVLSCRFKGSSLRLEGHDSLVRHVTDALQQDGISLHDFSGVPVSALLDRISNCFSLTNPENMRPYSFGFLGFFAYDAIRYFERIPNTTLDDRQIDDIHLQVHQVVLQFEGEKIYVIINEIEGISTPSREEVESFLHAYGAPVFAGFDPKALVVEEDVSREEFVNRVLRAKEYIREGDIFQVVLSKRDRVIGMIDPYEVYYRLKQVNPSPYMFFADYGTYRIFGTSPELQIRLENGIAEMKPIAGTTKGKGKTPEENHALLHALLQDEKERAEHLMLVDLCRNDLGRVCEAGSITVKEFMITEEYSHVYHIVSAVQGRVEKQVSKFDVFLATFPAGTLSGAPKVRAMEIIDELESVNRGPYGGVIGCFDFLGNMNTAIVIRTIIHQNGVSYLQAGAGIVADSDPEHEWNECNLKLRALRQTVFELKS